MAFKVPRVGVTEHSQALAGPAGGVMRTHDWEGRTTWADCDTPKGYDFSDLARFCQVAMARGAEVIYTLTGTPERYATNRFEDGYHRIGGASAPSNIAAAARFVAAAVRACNDPSDWNPKGLCVLTGFEPFNEWYENQAQVPLEKLAALLAVVYAAVKKADPRVVVLTSAQHGGRLELFDAYIASGAMEFADEVAVHPYNHQMAMPLFADMLAEFRKRTDLPLWLTECGAQPEQKADFATMTAAEQAAEWQRCVLYAGTQGVSHMVFYDLDGYALQAKGGILCMGDKPEMLQAQVSLVGMQGRALQPFASDAVRVKVSGKWLLL